MAPHRPDPKDVARAAARQARLDADRESLRQVAMAMLSGGKGEDAVDVLLQAVQALQHDNLRLVQRLATATRARFGRSSEKLDAEQLKQLVLALGATEAQAAMAEPLVPTPPPPTPAAKDEVDAAPKKKRSKHPGRTALSPDLPRHIHLVTVPAEERKCVHCGAEMPCIGHLDTETIEFVPARIEVHVERREKLACTCGQDITTAARQTSEPHQPRAGASLLAHLIEAKCDDALPIYRQQDQLRRLGFDVPLNTLYGYWDYATGLLQPVADAIVSTVLGDDVVGVDDTKLDFLDPADPRGKQRGHLWCFVGTGPLVGFVFTETWQAEDIEPWLSGIDGYIQCDDYKGYGASVTGTEGGPPRVLVPLERRLGCLMHVRRRFHRAYLGGVAEAGRPLHAIAAIYQVEAQAKEASLSPSERLALRQREAVPRLDELDRWVDEHLPKLLPTSPLGMAARYARDQRAFVRRCFSDGRFEVDNGRVEREIREPAIGRKNFLFSGSAAAAERLAAAYTVVQSARRVGVPVREYLIDVLGRLSRGWPARQLTELLPNRWRRADVAATSEQAAQKAE